LTFALAAKYSLAWLTGGEPALFLLASHLNPLA